MTLKPSVLILLPAILMPISSTSAEDLSLIETTYDVRSENENIGTLTLLRSRVEHNAQPAIEITTSMNLHVEHFLGDYTLNTKSISISTEDGIQIFDHKISENDKHYRITGEHHDQELWVSARQILTPAELDEKALADAAVGVASSAIPYLGLATSLLSGDQEGDGRIPLDLFDGISDQLPALLSEGLVISKKPQALQVLDTATLNIESGEYKMTGTEVITAAGMEFTCWVIQAQSPNKQWQMWIAEDAMGPFILRETGTDEDGPYALELKTYKENML